MRSIKMVILMIILLTRMSTMMLLMLMPMIFAMSMPIILFTDANAACCQKLSTIHTVWGATTP